MTLALARAHAVPKQWGRADLRPWSALGSKDAPIGEIGFDREDADAPEPGLLLKLLFTDEPLSIQIHPDGAQAASHTQVQQ
jgi:mannose-6-phosphate isomerase